MVKIDFGGVKEDVITRKEFTVAKSTKNPEKTKLSSHSATASKVKPNHSTCETKA